MGERKLKYYLYFKMGFQRFVKPQATHRVKKNLAYGRRLNLLMCADSSEMNTVHLTLYIAH